MMYLREIEGTYIDLKREPYKKTLTQWTQFSKKRMKRGLKHVIINKGISKLFLTRKSAKQYGKKLEQKPHRLRRTKTEYSPTF